MINILAATQCELTSIGSNVVIDGTLLTVIRIVYNGLRFGVPLLLIFFGMLDLGKAVIAQDDKDIAKGRKTFISRLIAAVIVFLVFSIVKILLAVFDKSNEIANNLNCILG